MAAMERLVQPGDIASSARLLLAALTGAKPGSVIVFYAGDAGAFSTSLPTRASRRG